MAKEWYLMHSPYDQLSGYESEAMDDFAQEGFLEILDSEMADDVEVCNYDTSVRTKTRAVIQNNVQDTRLKTLSRMMLTKIGTCKAGMYVHYKNRFWLIVGVVDDNKMYEKSILSLCNYKLEWKDKNGKIHARYANIANASQYNNGEQISKFYTIRSDQLMISIPDDEDSLFITSGMRFIIDKRCKIYEQEFDDTTKSDTSNPVMTYEATRINNVGYDYHDSGHLEIMVSQDEQRKSDGYYVIDGQGYWLAESREADIVIDGGDEPPTGGRSEIIADSYELYNGIEPNVYIAKFYDSEHHEVAVEDFTWTIDCDFTSSLEVSYDNNAICIYVDDNKLLNKSFDLLLSAEGYETVPATITIRAFI